MTATCSPLRYPGGKSILAPWIAWTMRYNKLSGGTYVEPYAGGAGVALYLLLNLYVDKIVINDLDPLIYSFWKTVVDDSDALISMIEDTPVSLAVRDEQKKIVENFSDYSITEVGFAAFYLNRTNRSGILNGGPIGGLSQSGKYKLDARFNKNTLIEKIKKIVLYARHIDVRNLDALELIDEYETESPSRALIYLDPPYFNKGSQLYRNFYTEDDHRKIADKMKSLKCPWITTYDNCDKIRELYSRVTQEEFSLTYSTGLKRTKGSEMMFYANMEIPVTPFAKSTIYPYPQAWEVVA